MGSILAFFSVDNWFDYTITLIGTVFTFIGATNSYFERKEENLLHNIYNRRNRRNYTVIIAGLLVSLIGGIYTTYNQIKEKVIARNDALLNKKKSDSLSSVLFSKQNQIIEIQKSQLDSLKNITSLTLELNAADSTIASLQKGLFEQIVGNGHMPSIIAFGHVKLFDTGSYYVNFYVNNKTKTPIYGVNIRLVDFYEISNRMTRVGQDSVQILLSNKFEIVEAVNKYFDYNVLYPNYRKFFYTSQIKKNDTAKSYNYRIYVGWGGKYGCQEDFTLKPVSNSSYFLYTSQIKFKFRDKDSIRNYSEDENFIMPP